MTGPELALFGPEGCESFLPEVMTAAFELMGIDVTYAPQPTGHADAEAVIAALRAGKWKGGNALSPLDEMLYQHVRLRDGAAWVRAVDTLVVAGEHVVGYCAAVDGLKSLLRDRRCRSGQRALVLGRGVGARLACYALARAGLVVTIVAPQRLEAHHLRPALGPGRARQAHAVMDVSRIPQVMREIDVVVNEMAEPLDIPWYRARPGIITVDLALLPRDTAFTDGARERGARTVEGWQVEVAKAAEAIRIWTGGAAPQEAMLEVAGSCLSKRAVTPGERPPESSLTDAQPETEAPTDAGGSAGPNRD